jgi:hypothetical protein
MDLAEQGKGKLNPDVYFKLAATATLGLSGQIRSQQTKAIQAPLVAANEFARQTTFGVIPGVKGENLALDPSGVAIAKMVGGIAGILTSGKLVVSALSKTTLLPKVGPILQQIPQRVKEVTLGIGTGAIMDAARPDGLPEEPAEIDITARMAHHIADVLGGGEAAERAALGLAGGVTGGGIAAVLLPVFRGIQWAREGRLANQLGDDGIEAVRQALQRAGVVVETGADKRAVVGKLLANMDKVSQSERLAAMSAADETRMDYVLNLLYSDPAFSGPPKLPDLVTDNAGKPVRFYHGSPRALEGAPRLSESEYGHAFYLSNTPEGASYFAGQPTSYTPAPNITPFYVRGKVLDTTGWADGSVNAIESNPDFVEAAVKLYWKAQGSKGKFEEFRQTALSDLGWLGVDLSGNHLRMLGEAARKTGYVAIREHQVVPSGAAYEAMAVFDQKALVPAFASQDAQYLAAVFRANPGGLSIAKGVSDVRAAEGLVDKLGLNVVSIKAGGDMIIMRPQVQFPEVGVITSRIRKDMDGFVEQVKALNRGKPSTRLSILPDGTVVKGEFNAAEMANRFKIKTGTVGHEVAVREHLGMMEVKIGEGGVIEVQLPSRVTQRQATVLGKMADRGVPEMRIVSTMKERAQGPAPGAFTSHGFGDPDIISAMDRNVTGGMRALPSREATIASMASTHEAMLPAGFHYRKVGDNLYQVYETTEKGTRVWGSGRSPNEAFQTAVDRGLRFKGMRPVYVPPGPGGVKGVEVLVPKEKTLKNPFGMQVEDALADLVQGAKKPKITADVVKKVQQYQQQGVFQGQAGILPDGYPVEILRKSGKKIAYRDPITGRIHRIPEENMTVLPTSLEGELAPSKQIFEAMDEAERLAFANLRRGINEGLAKPIKTIRDLESLAVTRGKLVTPIGQGRVRVYDQNTGESMVFDNIKEASTYVRNSLGPLPDLTPPEIEALLGFKPNLGFIGGGGPPHKFHEQMGIPDGEFAKAFEENTLGRLPPGAIGQFFTPTRGWVEDLAKKYNMPFDKVWANLQAGTVHKENFIAGWGYGEGPYLPRGVKSVKEIYKMAGKPDDGTQRLMMAWLESESDDVARKAIEAQLTSRQIEAAKEARKWFGLSKEDGLFKVLQVEAPYLTDYAPHLRQQAEVFGGNLREAWRISKGTPLPKAVDWAADHVRDGTLDIYEDRIFHSMMQYLHSGARSRYLNQPLSDAQRLIRGIPDNAVKGPLVNYIEALKGWEFQAQRSALDASFSNMLKNLGMSAKVAQDIGERMSLAMLGMSYQATMAFRPGLAIRNAAQILQTTWPLLGSVTDDAFQVGLGKALTRAGKDEAILAGAISIRQHGLFAQTEVRQALPQPLQKMSDLGFAMYDGADTFARAVTFHTAKARSEKAIAKFAKAVQSGRGTEQATRDLVRESGAMVLSPRFKDEFLRKVAISPDDAGNFLGKNLTDITQFLYGRGNQPRWMRSVPGRFFGQFGTWPLWYIDFVLRSTKNMVRNGYKREAVKFLGKLALVDAAIYEGGRRANIDLRRWMSTNAIFGVPPLGRAPATSILVGIQDLSRGTSEAVFSTYDSPANTLRLGLTKQLLAQTGLAFVPNYYAVRDIGRLMNARTPTEMMAAALATRPTTEWTVQQRMDLLFAPGRMSTDIDLEEMGDPTPTATEIILRGMELSKERPRLVVPPGLLPMPQTPASTPAAPATPPAARSDTVAGPIMDRTALPKTIRTGESNPVQ